MISRIEGVLEGVENGTAQLACGHIMYEVLVPGIDRQRLATLTGEPVVFHTLHFLEGQGQGSSYLPRLIGFATVEDRAFFQLFTTVKGVGARKALRALQMPFHTIAAAIAAKDVDVLKSLPEIGARTAETIVAELYGKVGDFVREGPGVDGRSPAEQQHATLADEALSVLSALGEPKLQAMQLVDRAFRADPEIDRAEDLVAAVYRLRELP